MTTKTGFEAWADERDRTHGGKLRSADGGFDYPLGRLLLECWNAAKAHSAGQQVGGEARDAERYRWLRSRPLDDDEIYIAVDSPKHMGRWGLGGDDPDGCDAAIDAAIRAAMAEKGAGS